VVLKRERRAEFKPWYSRNKRRRKKRRKMEEEEEEEEEQHLGDVYVCVGEL
jgi:hypothetical protein